MRSNQFRTRKYFFILSTIYLTWTLHSCNQESSIRAEFMRQRMEQFIVDEKPAANHIIFNDRILEWDTADFIVKYLGEKIDTTTKAFELINATTVDKEKIIKL